MVGQAAIMLSMGKLPHAHCCFQKRRGGFFSFFPRSPSFPALTPSISHHALFQQSLWFFKKLIASQASLQVTLFQHLNHNPLQPFSPHFVLPSLFLPSLFLSLSVYDGQVSWGKTVGRMQTCCHGNRNPPSPSGLLSN